MTSKKSKMIETPTKKLKKVYAIRVTDPIQIQMLSLGLQTRDAGTGNVVRRYELSNAHDFSYKKLFEFYGDGRKHCAVLVDDDEAVLQVLPIGLIQWLYNGIKVFSFREIPQTLT